MSVGCNSPGSIWKAIASSIFKKSLLYKGSPLSMYNPSLLTLTLYIFIYDNLVIRDKFNIYKENSIGMFSNCSEELKDKIQNDKNITPLNFKKMNMKMNKLLNISKSIPNYLLKNINSNERNQDEDNKQFNSINTSINISCWWLEFRRVLFRSESSTKRTMNNEEKSKRNKKNNIIYSCDKNGRKYLRRLSLLL